MGCIGALSRTALHVVSILDFPGVNKYITLEDKPVELSALQGMVINGQPHFHMVVSHLEETYTGHLEEGCVVLYIAEITLLEVKNLNLQRKRNEAGLLLIGSFALGC